MLLKRSSNIQNKSALLEIHALSCYTKITAAIVLLASVMVFYINANRYQFPGNNYFPPNVLLSGVLLILIYFGVYVYVGYASKSVQMMREVVHYYLTMAVITFATIAIQYTPFPTIDHAIFSLETTYLINLPKWVEWTANHPLFYSILDACYCSLVLQMCFIPITIIIAQRYQYLYEYYFLLLMSVLLGFTVYYLFPTTAPASIIDSSVFLEMQRATGLKFQQIHHHIKPTTADGGLISFPSFHTIWAFYLLYLVREWPFALALLIPVNSLLVMSCVLLGWHYLIDIFGSILVIFISFAALVCIRQRSQRTLGENTNEGSLLNLAK